MESFQPYSEYLEIEKELKELDSLEFDIEKRKHLFKFLNKLKTDKTIIQRPKRV